RAESPEPAGNFSTKSIRKQAPASSGRTGLEKTRFILDSHLTIDRTDSTRRSTVLLAPPPLRCEAATLHERTQADLLRRGKSPLATHAPHPGNQRCPPDPAARLFLHHRCRQRRTALRPSPGHASLVPFRQEEDPETGHPARRAPQSRGAYRAGSRHI